MSSYTPPRLTHLNADTSWLLHLPSTTGPVALLLDAWLTHEHTAFHRLFLRQEHVVQPAYSSVTELGRIDAVLVSFHGSDHCNKETLQSVAPDVPVWAVEEAARAARGWRHFRSIHEIPVFDRPQADWDTAYAPVLPGIHVFQIRSTDPKEMVNIHRSLLITFPAEPAVASRNPGARQAILCAQHGLHASTNLDYLAASSPPIEILAVMHGTREAILPWYLGGVANLGVHNGRALIEKLLPRPRYWIATHDGESIFHGLVGAVIKMRPMTFRDAISKKGKAAGEDEQETRAALQEELGVTCVALGNGESLTLE